MTFFLTFTFIYAKIDQKPCVLKLEKNQKTKKKITNNNTLPLLMFQNVCLTTSVL